LPLGNHEGVIRRSDDVFMQRGSCLCRIHFARGHYCSDLAESLQAKCRLWQDSMELDGLF
jgi:hypothetical protein